MPATLRAVRPLTLLGLATAAVTLTACDDKRGGSITQPLASPALVKIVHAVAGAGAVSVRVDDAPTLTNFLYGTVSPNTFSRYLELPEGQRRISVLTANGTMAIDGTATLTALQSYTIVAAGAATGTGATAPRLLVLTDNVAAPAAGQVRVRAVHVAASLGAVDIYTSPPNTAASTATPVYTFTRRFQNVPFLGSGTIEVPAANYSVCVIAAGTTPTASGANCRAPVFATGALAAGTAVTLFARDPNPAVAAEATGAAAGPRVFAVTDRVP